MAFYTREEKTYPPKSQMSPAIETHQLCHFRIQYLSLTSPNARLVQCCDSYGKRLATASRYTHQYNGSLEDTNYLDCYA